MMEWVFVEVMMEWVEVQAMVVVVEERRSCHYICSDNQGETCLTGPSTRISALGDGMRLSTTGWRLHICILGSRRFSHGRGKQSVFPEQQSSCCCCRVGRVCNTHRTVWGKCGDQR